MNWAYALLPAPKRPIGFGDLGAADVQRYERVASQRAGDARTMWKTVVTDPLSNEAANRRPKFTNQMGRAAARGLADDDAVRWLADNPAALLEAKFLAGQIAEVADEMLGTLQGKTQHRRLADHFWCDVLGALVLTLEEAEGAIEKLRDRAIDWLVDEVWKRFRASRQTDWGATPNGRTAPGPSRAQRDDQQHLADEVLEHAVRSLLRKICDGLGAKQITFDILVLKLRLIAIWLCPDVVAHRLVWEHCWIPLAKGWIDDDVLELMANAFSKRPE
ncbi:hypothetical protein [Nocardia sp. CDC160]|uniref:hypothetical protein n=1 Tax=Nocardia sp. CDC160 TaxID=3112166 RepID=UPI002DB618A0|nr:hypothetical protein [Nocardia sp. CDC160]MEC3920306.1 hypothetical protein [Nocardia sp. CDC160]